MAKINVEMLSNNLLIVSKVMNEYKNLFFSKKSFPALALN
jgi:hypothetical protein